MRERTHVGYPFRKKGRRLGRNVPDIHPEGIRQALFWRGKLSQISADWWKVFTSISYMTLKARQVVPLLCYQTSKHIAKPTVYQVIPSIMYKCTLFFWFCKPIVTYTLPTALLFLSLKWSLTCSHCLVYLPAHSDSDLCSRGSCAEEYIITPDLCSVANF